MKGRKGQTILTVFFLMVAFWLCWIFFIAPLINVIVDQAISTGNITGISALVLTNLNLIIGILSVLVLFWVIRYGY